MSDNRVISINKYTVGNISKISTNISITKRPYDNTSFSSNERDKKSKSFRNTLKSSNSKESQDHKTNDFSEVLSHELNDRLILDSRETSRVINTHFDNTNLNKTNSNIKPDSTELHAKLRDAMKVEIDPSELCKKLQLLNAIKAESDK